MDLHQSETPMRTTDAARPPTAPSNPLNERPPPYSLENPSPSASDALNSTTYAASSAILNANPAVYPPGTQSAAPPLEITAPDHAMEYRRQTPPPSYDSIWSSQPISTTATSKNQAVPPVTQASTSGGMFSSEAGPAGSRSMCFSQPTSTTKPKAAAAPVVQVPISSGGGMLESELYSPTRPRRRSSVSVDSGEICCQAACAVCFIACRVLCALLIR